LRKIENPYSELQYSVKQVEEIRGELVFDDEIERKVDEN